MKKALLAAIAAACVFQAWLALHAPVGMFQDDALHLLLARAIRHGAFAFPDGSPAADPLPGFAFLLALPAWVVEPRWGLLRWPALAAGWAALGLTWRLARRVLGGEEALAVTLVVAMNPVFVENAGVLRPDILFLASALGVLDFLAEARPGPAALLAAGAALLRPQGTLLVLAAAAALWRRRGGRAAAKFATALLLLAAWTARNALVAGTASGYVENWARRAASLRGLAGLARHWGRLAAALGHGFTGLRAPGLALAMIGAVLLVAAAAGAWDLSRGRREPPQPEVWGLAAAIFGASVLALHLTWSVSDPRYAIPLLPLCWIFVFLALRRLRSGCRIASLAITVALAAAACQQDGVLARVRARAPAELWPRTMAWIRSQTPGKARIQSMFDMPVMLLTGRQSEEPPLVRNRDSWLAHCIGRGVGYVHLDQDLQRWRTLPPERFAVLLSLPAWVRSTPYAREVFRDPEEGSAIWRIEHPDPRRFRRAWSEYGLALEELSAGAAPRVVRARLESAARLEPGLALPWAVMGHLAEGRGEKIRCLRKALRLDPNLDAARGELRQAFLGPAAR